MFEYFFFMVFVICLMLVGLGCDGIEGFLKVLYFVGFWVVFLCFEYDC